MSLSLSYTESSLFRHFPVIETYVEVLPQDCHASLRPTTNATLPKGTNVRTM